MPGVMELLPREQVAFQRMSDVVRQVFERFGFVPIATPAIELSEVLLTKSGGDTERQVYFVQSTGALGREGDALPELALRYDLTVPLARYVAEHEHQLAFPFRRYQMQRVYRGERAQRGRFREFHQCDIDVIGKDTLDIGFDAEMPAVIDAVFSELSIGAFTIQLNHRKLMHGFLEHAGVEGGERQAAVLREIDKLDRLGPEAVEQTLAGPGFGLAASTIDRIREFVAIRSNGLADGLARIEAFGSRGPQFDAGASELREVLERIRGFGVADDRVAINLSIARGLDYYTGTVYETTLDDWPAIGSICSGGRYENLAGSYTRSRLPGVGISIGLTRLFWQLSQAGKVDCGDSCVQVLVAWSAEACRDFATDTASMLRRAGLNTELQLQGRKLARQFQYADRAGIRFVVVCGEDEASRDAVAVKDLRSGEQLEYARERLAGGLHAALAGGDAG